MPHRLDSATNEPNTDPVQLHDALSLQAPPNLLVNKLTSEPHVFLQPSLPLHTDALRQLRETLDPVAREVSHVQQQRLVDLRRKRKRAKVPNDDSALRIKKIHTDSFGVDQVWEQVRRVIDAAREEVERSYEEWQASAGQAVETDLDGHAKALTYEDSAPNGEISHLSDDKIEDMEAEVDVDGLDGNMDDYDGIEEDLTDGVAEDSDEHDSVDGQEAAEEYVADKHGLNDGFFSIDEFNKRSDFLEQQDLRGDNDGAASDEEDVDWDANPLTSVFVHDDDGGQDNNSTSESEDEGDGPTFGNPDAPSDADGGDEVGEGDVDAVIDMGNTNEIMYADFFAPPAQKKNKKRKGRPNPHNFPAAAVGSTNDAEDMDRTMAAVHRDLFEDDGSELDAEDDERPLPDLDPDDPRARKSAHERRTAALAEEIRRLEAANIAKREWTLSGEARAADRPLNSLLEEDLDFERAGKPVPVITAEVSESIEDLIKRRILAHDFQDILRRRPDDLATGKSGRRGRLDFELDDSKSKRGLAEEYEEEYSKQTDPSYVDAKDEKLRNEQKEIETLWKDVCAQLDSLSSWHFRPKAATASMEIRVDAPTITMEDVRPSTAGEVAGASQLAPQELYRAGESTAKNNVMEVAGKSGLPTAREELSREDKKRRRRREKERIRKGSAGENVKGIVSKDKKASNKQMLDDLKRGNVSVIGKKGEVSAVDGRLSAREGGQGAAQYML